MPPPLAARIELDPPAPARRDQLIQRFAMGALVKVGLYCGFPLSAIVTRSAVEDLHLSPGMPITASVKAGAVHLVPRRDAVVYA